MQNTTKFGKVTRIVLSCLMLSVLLGCKEENIEDKNLLGSWKCIGFGNTTTDSISSVVLYDSDSYTLNFKEDNQLEGKACSVSFSSEFLVLEKNSKVSIQALFKVDLADCNEGGLFMRLLPEVTHYSFSEDKLLLFYNQTEYLIFKPLKS